MAKDTPSIKPAPTSCITGTEHSALGSQSLEEVLKAFILRNVKIAS